ncbi:MAG TPA: M42 family peptidase, partial [Rubellimicrobium sp.]|nr:M42 family peptidase [Rubellimicrobium sp.]
MSLRDDLGALCLLPGLSGHEEPVAAWLRDRLGALGLTTRTDRLGNLILTLTGDAGRPSVMVFAHMDQLGFFVRKVEPDGLIRVERMGGVAEKAMLAQAVLLCPPGRDPVPGVIMIKAHHATQPGEKYAVPTAPEIRIDTGHGSKAAVEAAGIRIGTPVVYHPRVLPLANDRLAGTAVDDRAGCAVLLALAERLKDREDGPTVHLVWSVQEEFNLRGAVVAAQALRPDIAIQIDL